VDYLGESVRVHPEPLSELRERQARIARERSGQARKKPDVIVHERAKMRNGCQRSFTGEVQD
jgi:hypothetical protein